MIRGVLDRPVSVICCLTLENIVHPDEQGLLVSKMIQYAKEAFQRFYIDA